MHGKVSTTYKLSVIIFVGVAFGDLSGKQLHGSITAPSPETPSVCADIGRSLLQLQKVPPSNVDQVMEQDDGKMGMLTAESVPKMGSRRLRNLFYQQSSSLKKARGLGKYVPGSDGTYSQNYQDKWLAAVARHNGWDKSDGFFLDLGAFDGLKCSNSAFVEEEFGWRGICVEARPVPGAFKERHCVLVSRALSDVSGKEMRFYGTPGTQLQHIHKQDIDQPDDKGTMIHTLNVPDLLRCVNSTDKNPDLGNVECEGVPKSMQVPTFINFISLDIEGQGLNVLKTFPFDLIKVGAWVVENEPDARKNEEANAVLLKQGYIRVPVENPGVDKYFIQPRFWDQSLAKKDWRVHPEGSEC